jgi:hypothetical protein
MKLVDVGLAWTEVTLITEDLPLRIQDCRRILFPISNQDIRLQPIPQPPTLIADKVALPALPLNMDR